MQNRELICVNCPKGCRIMVKKEEDRVVDVQGYSCENGKAYAIQETIRPMRILTTTVYIDGGIRNVLPVISDGELPLDMMEEVMKEIHRAHIDAPVSVNDIVVENICNTGVNMIASRSMKARVC